jgi:LPS export ABC transporter permease LptG
MLSAVTFYLNIELVPKASRALRQVAVRAALVKLDSPIDPRSFNTEIPNYVAYVREGDNANGEWRRVFLFSRRNGTTQIVTARSGRIDSAAGQSELVLIDAVRFEQLDPSSNNGSSYSLEHLAQLRVVLDTGRNALLSELKGVAQRPDEMSWGELRRYASTKRDADWREAVVSLNKRLSLSFSPIVFAVLGVSLGLRVRKGGRAFGILLSLVMMLGYYLVTLAGEGMGRAGTIHPVLGTWLGTIVSLSVGLLLLGGLRLSIPVLPSIRGRSPVMNFRRPASGKTFSLRNVAGLASFPSLMDISLFRALGLSFAFVFVTLVSIFMIFTVFELWRFVVASESGLRLLSKYLFYLLPFVCVQLLPSVTLLSLLATYALMSRRSETIAWWASGQSFYRLMMPGLLFVLIIAAGEWYVQERFMPKANIKQDSLRAQIHERITRVSTGSGHQWLAASNSNRLYSYEYDEQHNGLIMPEIYEFDSEGIHLTKILSAEYASWQSANMIKLDHPRSVEFKNPLRSTLGSAVLVDGVEPPSAFKPGIDKPSQLSAVELRSYIKNLRSRGEDVTSLAAALQKKYTEPFSILVMAFVGIPLAMSFGRRSAVGALSLAIGIALAFWATSGVVQQLGVRGILPSAVSAWAPLSIYASIGLYLTSRTRT